MYRPILMIPALLIAVSCSSAPKSNDEATPPKGEVSSQVDYVSIYDQPADKGQWWLPEPTVVPANYLICTGADINDFGRYEINKTNPLEGLQYANLAGSLAGLVNRAVENGETKTAIWLDGKGPSFTLCMQELNRQNIFQSGSSDAISIVKSGKFDNVIKGYILTDVVKNPESSVVAAVASHVYAGLIVDVRDQAEFDNLGLKMLYDATDKSTKDSWREFKDKCNNSSLVLMPAKTNDLKDYSIANNLFVINIRNNSGDNWELLDEVLAWLKPCSPVYGWEDLDEHTFVQPVSESGNLMICNNFSMNKTLTSMKYKSRQNDLLVNVFNPKKIDFSNNKSDKFVSYYLSDGDNVQWLFHIWNDGWFKHSQTVPMKMAFGIPSTNLDMIAPAVYRNIVKNQNPENTLVENCGGGYIYIDDFAKRGDRTAKLHDLAKKTAANMRQHRLKVLGLFTNDARSNNAKDAYKIFIEENDQLEGVIVVQYAPYNGGHGDIYWYKNSKGVEIPVVTVKFTIWNFDTNDQGGQGTPAFIASRLKMTTGNHSLVDIHAWSSFKDIGTSEDLLGESGPGGTVSGAGAAQLCHKRLPKNYHAVSLQELIWRIRMDHNPEKTKEIIDSYK